MRSDHAYRNPSRSWPLACGTCRHPDQPRGVHHRQGDDDSDIRRGVDVEAQRDSERLDQDRTDGRPDDSRAVHHDTVEAHRVREILAPHHLEHEGLPGGVVNDVHEAQQQRHEVHDPHGVHAGGHDDAERERKDAGRDLRAVQELALVEAVGEHAAPGAQQQHRQELERGDQTERGPVVVRQVQDEHGLRELLHPRSADRDDLTDEVEAVVAVVQRSERGASQPAHPGHRGSSMSCSSNIAARANTARSSAVRVRSRWAR